MSLLLALVGAAITDPEAPPQSVVGGGGADDGDDYYKEVNRQTLVHMSIINMMQHLALGFVAAVAAEEDEQWLH